MNVQINRNRTEILWINNDFMVIFIEGIWWLFSDNKVERESLNRCFFLAKRLLEHVDNKVDAHEKNQRLFEIYHKLDARNTVQYRGKKFKKSDLLSSNRKLMYEQTLSWKSARGKPVGMYSLRWYTDTAMLVVLELILNKRKKKVIESFHIFSVFYLESIVLCMPW